MSAADTNNATGVQSVSRYAVLFLGIAILAMIADGFDIAAIGFMVPELVKEWHVPPSSLAPALSAGVIGLFLGAPLFGYVGDRFGRKTAILGCLSVVGLFSLLTMLASDLTQLVVLRLITGTGLGGLIPNIIALAAEVAPKDRRGTFILIVSFGVPAGFVIPGWVAALFVPTYGWPALMLAGGILPLLVAALAYLFVRESESYLKDRAQRRAGLPAQQLSETQTLTVATAAQRSLVVKLFAGGLAFATPLIWIALAANQFTNFFTLSWLPTLLQAEGLTTAQAGYTTAMYSIGGIAGGATLIFLVDKFGALPLVVFFLVGGPFVAFFGLAHATQAMLIAIIATAGFCVSGNNFGINAILGMVYPTSVRSQGPGWAHAFGRLGALMAQIIGGLLLAQKWTVQEMYLAPACSLIIGAAAILLFVIVCRKRLGNFKIDDMSGTGIKPGA